MGVLARAPAAAFFEWSPAGVGAVALPCPRCGASVRARLLENLLEVLCAACGRNVALERSRALSEREGVEAVCAQLLELGILDAEEVDALRGPDGLPLDVVERLVDAGALRRDLRLTLDLDLPGGTHVYSAAGLTEIVDAEEVERALAQRRDAGGVLAELLQRAALDRIAASLRAVGAEAGLERLTSLDALDPECHGLLPPRALEAYRAVPVRRAGDAVVVALWDPLDLDVVSDLEALLKGPVHPILAEASALSLALERLGVQPELSADGIGEAEEDERSDHSASELADDPFATILLDALEEGAREVLIEPQGRVASLRFRVRGELQRRRTIPVEAADLLAERLEAIAGAQGADTRLHAGSARLEVSGLPIALDYRVIRTPFGPSLALELESDDPELPRGLTGLGLSFDALAAFEAILAEDGGLIVLAAPRGQGTSAAYHAVLERLARLGREVISLEAHIQKVVTGTTQLDLEAAEAEDRGALLRPAPDWLGLDGSLDPAWLEVAVDTVLAGGGAVVTVPAPDARTAILRLELAGLPTALLSRLVRGVVGRRVVPHICARCKFPRPGAPPEAPDWIGLGCAACDQGVSSFLPLAELLVPSEGLLTPFRGPLLRDRAQALVAEGRVTWRSCRDLLR